MAEADLSKIVGLIMENPDLIEQIKGLSQKTESAEGEKEIEASESNSQNTDTEIVKANTEISDKRVRRKELLHALKAYVSEERGRAIESMLSIADILDMMKTR